MISIIIPTFRRPALLDRALSSTTKNIYRAIDVIVIDDDADLSAAAIAQRYNNVRYFAKRGVNRGLANSRNIGINLSKNPYLIFLDDDDYLVPGAIDRFIEAASASISFYYSDFFYIQKTGEVRTTTRYAQETQLLVVNEIPVGAYMIQKSSITHEFDPSMKSHEDWNFLLDNVQWNRSQHIPEALVCIDKTLEDELSMQNRRRKSFWMDFIGIYSKHPANDLAGARSQKLAELGIHVENHMLQNKIHTGYEGN